MLSSVDSDETRLKKASLLLPCSLLQTLLCLIPLYSVLTACTRWMALQVWEEIQFFEDFLQVSAPLGFEPRPPLVLRCRRCGCCVRSLPASLSGGGSSSAAPGCGNSSRKRQASSLDALPSRLLRPGSVLFGACCDCVQLMSRIRHDKALHPLLAQMAVRDTPSTHFARRAASEPCRHLLRASLLRCSPRTGAAVSEPHHSARRGDGRH